MLAKLQMCGCCAAASFLQVRAAGSGSLAAACLHSEPGPLHASPAGMYPEASRLHNKWPA